MANQLTTHDIAERIRSVNRRLKRDPPGHPTIRAEICSMLTEPALCAAER